MNEDNNKLVILFSSDESLIQDVNLKQIGKDSVVSNGFFLSVEPELTAEFISQGSMAVVYDLDLVNNNLSLAIVDILQLRNANLDRPLILVGSKESLKSALDVERIRDVVTKAVRKPNAANKLFISIAAASNLAHGDGDVGRAKSKGGLYAVIGATICVLGFALFYLLADQDKSVAPKELIVAKTPDAVSPISDVGDSGVDELQAASLAEVKRLKALASEAYGAGRLISPKGDNAMEYYHQILEIDDYDDDAYTGKYRIVKQLRASFPQLIDAGELDKARAVVSTLIEIEPFNISNSALRATLDEAYAADENSEADESNETAEQADRKQREERDKNLLIEEGLASKIASSIESGSLTPPQTDNAYELLLSAARQASVRESVLKPLKASLENKLIERMQRALANTDLSKAENDLGFIRNLDRNHSALPGLTASLVEAKERAKPVVATNVVATNVVKVKPAVVPQDIPKSVAEVATKSTNAQGNDRGASLVIPFQVLNKAQPDYPRRAYLMDIEGWVKLQFQINEKGKPINISVVDAEPKEVFDKAGIKAIKRSRFSPAKNSVTNEALVSEMGTIRFNFSLGG